MRSRRFVLVPAAIACLGAAPLLWWVARARPLWVDEEMLLLNVRDRGVAQLAGALWLDQSAPLGWLALERLALLTLGTSEPALRLIPALFGIGTLVTAVWVGSRWMTPLGGAILVSLCAFGEWLVFFTLELKHYSADAFLALLVPALAVWALEPEAASDLRRRVLEWWAIAAVALWFGNGALFVTPGCAAVLAAACWRRQGRPLARVAVAGGLVWLASFALCYHVELRYAVANEYLRNYWAFAFPPVHDGLRAMGVWFAHQLPAFARKPAGSGIWPIFWSAYAAGILFALATQTPRGLMFAMTPLSALALAAFHIVPPFERLALWVVPSVYVGIGLCGDAAWRLAAASFSRTRTIAAICGVLAGGAAIWVCGDIVERGAVAVARKPMSNYGLDDRASIRWLLTTHRAGDAVLTTHYGLAALWWYGRVNVSEPDATGRLADGSPVYELQYVDAAADCDAARTRVADALRGRARAAVYLGFRLNVLPPGFDALVLRDLGTRGALVGYKPFAEESRLAIFDLQAPPRRAAPSGAPGVGSSDGSLALPGCVSVKRARRW